jgi:hypothetical protein
LQVDFSTDKILLFISPIRRPQEKGMEWFNALMTSVKDFRDLVFRPLTLFTFGLLALLLLILPKAHLAWLGLSVLNEQHRGKISIAVIVLFAVGIIRTLDVYFFPWRKQRKQQEQNKEIFRRRLETLSKDELLILAYCLSRNRITFFVRHHSHNFFDVAIDTLSAKGFFRALPGNMQGAPFYITDDTLPAIQYFRDYIINKSAALSPQCEKDFEFFDEYQKTLGFGQIETSAQKKEIEPQSEYQHAEFNYTLYTKDVFYEVIWKWRYRFEFGQKPLDLTPHCPDCERRLVPGDPFEGDGIFVDPNGGQRYKYVACPVHRKDYDIPVDRQGDYVTVIANIMNNIESGKWAGIVDQQENRIRVRERKE